MSSPKVRLVVPTGRLQEAVLRLLLDAGLAIDTKPNDYRPAVRDPRFDVKLLKAANIPKLVEYGAHDIGFTGLDWVRETAADVATLLDTQLMPVRIVCAAPIGSNPFASKQDRALVVASEYEQLTAQFMGSRNVEWRYIRTFGATEVFPPEDADLIVDNVATGRTLLSNGLMVIEEILASSTLFLANHTALRRPGVGEIIAEVRMFVQSVLDARQRVLLDMNVPASCLDAVVRLLPAMKSPTIQKLYGDDGFAVRAAVPRAQVNRLIPLLRQAGAVDLLQTEIQRVIV